MTDRVTGSPGATSVLNTKDAVLRAQLFAKLCEGMTANSAQGIMQSFLAKGFGTPRQEEEIQDLTSQLETCARERNDALEACIRLNSELDAARREQREANARSASAWDGKP